MVDFVYHHMCMYVSFTRPPKPDPDVEVESSAMQRSPVKIEDSEEETDDDLDMAVSEPFVKVNGDTQEHTQGPYSTSREHLSTSPKTYLPPISQPVLESPVRPRLVTHGSTISAVPESIPKSSLLGGGAGEGLGGGIERTQSNAQSLIALGGATQDQLEETFKPSEVADSAPYRETVEDVEEMEESSSHHLAIKEESAMPVNQDTYAAHANADHPAHNEEPRRLLQPVDLDRPNNHAVKSIPPPEDDTGHEDANPTSESSSEKPVTEASEDLFEPVRQHATTEADEDPDSTKATPSQAEDTIMVTAKTPVTAIKTRKRKTVTDAKSTPTTTKRRRTESERLTTDLGTPHEESTPGSTMRQRRLSPRATATPSPAGGGRDWQEKPPRIMFPTDSKVRQLNGLVRFLKQQRCSEAKDQKPASFDLLCVDPGELKTTAKLLISLVHNKIIVTDDWVTQSSKEERLLGPEPYLPHALKDGQGKDRSILFLDEVIYFTPKLRKDYGKGWDDIQAITRQTGAKVVTCAPSKIPKNTQPAIYLGSENDDVHVVELQAEGKPVYRKDLLTHSIIAGQLVDEGDFALPLSGNPGSPSSTASSKATKGKKAKTKKK